MVAEVVVFTLHVGVCLFQNFVSKTENVNKVSAPPTNQETL